MLPLFKPKEDLALWWQQGQEARCKALIQQLLAEARKQDGLLS